MKNRIVAIVLTMAMATSLVACGNKKPDAPASVTEESMTEESVTEESVTEESVEEEPEEEEPAFVSQMGYNLIENGDLSEGLDNYWYFYTNGGKGSFDCVDGQMVVHIDDNGKVEHGIQIYYDGFALNQGSVYKLSFDIASTLDRTIDARIQKNGGDYHAYILETVDATAETQHVEVEFTMNEASDPAPRFCFNMGFLVEEKSYGSHDVTLDNFELYCIDESNTVTGDGSVETPDIQINQVGYRPEDTKTATFTGKKIDSEFTVVNVDTDEVVYEGNVSASAFNENTGRDEATADFSALKDAGTYKIVADKCGESFEFVIADDVYDEAFKASVDMFYLQRCGAKLDAGLAGDFAHDACHNGKATIYGTSDQIDVSGGWHDAGDYGRYVVSGAKSVADLLLAYELYPEAFDNSECVDVLEEVKYELDWMFKMQADNGGVYHKVTCEVFPETVMPEDETDELIVCPISTTATGDFAAVMAMASRVYLDSDASYAAKCRGAAMKAYEYLDKTDGGEGFKNPGAVVTGEYGDEEDIDERLWAAAELFKATGEKEYSDAAAKILKDMEDGDLGWAEVTIYGAYAYATSTGADKTALNNAKNILKTHAEIIADNASKDSYNSALYLDYPWGSNMNIADAGMSLLLCDEATGSNYSKLAKAQLDYLFGNNGTSYCFLTGFGSFSPEDTHHRPSQFLGQTMAGMLVGGPNANLEDPYAQAVLADAAPSLCYVDNSQSFSCNEITIYWNSPLVFLLAGIMSE